MGMRSATKCARYDPFLTAKVPCAHHFRYTHRLGVAPRLPCSTNCNAIAQPGSDTGIRHDDCRHQHTVRPVQCSKLASGSSRSRTDHGRRPSPPTPYYRHRPHRPHWKWGAESLWASRKVNYSTSGRESTPYSTASAGARYASPPLQLVTNGPGDVFETLATIVEKWTNIAIEIRQQHGIEAVWRHLEALRSKDASLLAAHGAEKLRREVLWAAVQDDESLEELLHIARRLCIDHGFQWPQLWAEVMFRLIKVSTPARTISWHERLYLEHRPSRTVFVTLLAHFSVGASPKMILLLQKLHIRSCESQIYDELIPRVFTNGSLASTLAWRRHLVHNNDFPKDQACHKFVDFLSRYYPQITLSNYERAILLRPFEEEQEQADSDQQNLGVEKTSQTLVARWFASTWTSVDFAISLVQRFGIKRIGPHALQALALRTPVAQDLRLRFKQLHDLNIAIDQTMYCQLVQHFAEQDQDDLLKSLLRSDVHPDEFKDPGTMHLLLSSALESRDIPLERLTRAILQFMSRDQGILAVGPRPPESTVQIRKELVAAFRMPGWFLRRNRQPSPSLRASLRFEKALDTARKAFEGGIGVPTKYWRRLLFHLGQSERFPELEGMILEILRFYGDSGKPLSKPLIAVHYSDLPKIAARATKTLNTTQDKPQRVMDGLQRWQQTVDETPTQKEGRHNVEVHMTDLPDGYIHHDLPKSHRCHPLHLIFHERLQRSLISWCFRAGVQQVADTQRQSLTTGLEDMTMGLRLLKILRDAGVVVRKQTLRSALVAQINAASLPRRRSHRHDQIELDRDLLMDLFERDWGSPIFESREHLDALLAARKDAMERNGSYSRLTSSSSMWLLPEPLEDGQLENFRRV